MSIFVTKNRNKRFQIREEEDGSEYLVSKVSVDSAIDQYSVRDIKFWRIIIGFGLASCLVFANLYIVQPLLPEYVRDFNISPTLASLSLTMSTISLVIGLLIFGFFSDRIGRLPILHWTLGLSIIPLLVIPLVDSFYWFLFWRFMVGFTLAGLPAVGVAYISEEVQLKHRGFAVSLYIASNALGGMVGRVIGGYIADIFSWQTTFYVLGISGIIITILCILFLPRSQHFKRYDRALLTDLKGMAIHLKNPLLFVAFIFGIMLQISFTGVWTYLPFYLEGYPFYLSITFISFMYLTYSFGIIGAPYAGHLASRYGFIKILLVGLIILVFGNAMTLLSQLSFVIIGLSLICLGFFIAHSMASAWVGANAKHHKSGATSLYLVSYYFGVSISGIINGVMWSNFHWNGVIAFCTGSIIVAGGIFYLVTKGKEPLHLSEKIS